MTPEERAEIHSYSLAELKPFYERVWESGDAHIAELGCHDRFFLLVYLLNRKDALDPWIFQRCREVEKDPDDHLDLWAREHYKSTIITYAGVIQEVLKNPEITVGIFSFNRPSAKKFLFQIKTEFEENRLLKQLYSKILWTNPKRDAPKWSEDGGIVVKRKTNPKESTIEAIGLIEGLPAGPHYELRVYDDVITENEVGSPEMMQKALKMWQQSQNLGKMGGRRWHAGTRYHFNDPYRFMLDEDILVPRIHPATDDGTPSGKPYLLTHDELAGKRKDQGPYLFSCQQLLNPVADEAQGFKREWIKYHDGRGRV